MRPWPRSLAGQMVAVLILALLTAQIVAAIAFMQDRERALIRANRGDIVERTVALVRILAASPRQRWPVIVDAMQTPRFRSVLGDEPLFATDGDDLDDEAGEARVGRFIERRIAKTGAGPVRVEIDEPSLFGSGRGHRHGPPGVSLALAVRLPDGTWLNLEHGLRPPRFWRVGTLVYLLVTALAVSLAGMFMVRRITRPVRALALASERLGRGETVAPLRTQGPVELARAASAFNRMQERLRRFVDDRTQMLAAVSHDLRTPITTLRLRAEFVEDGENRARMLDTLAEMEAMTEATLAFLREEARAEPVRRTDLTALVESIADDLHDQGGEVRIDETSRHVLACRPVALKRALRNLIENAVRYGKRAQIAVTEEEDGLSILVDDDGPGIPEADLERVFEPFVRLEASRSRATGGSGLGLAIARSIVRGHGGDVVLSNRPEGGLRVRVRLPGPAP